MKIYILISLCLLLLSCANVAHENIKLENFSVVPPDDWELKLRNADEVEFTKSTGPCEEAYISVHSVRAKKILSLEETWEKIKPGLISGTDETQKEQKISINDTEWMVLERTQKYKDETLRYLFLLTIKDNIRYSVQFGSSDKVYQNMRPAFDLFLNTLVLTPLAVN